MSKLKKAPEVATFLFRASRWVAFSVVVAATLLLLGVFGISASRAGDDDAGGTFLTAFPDNDVYQVGVFGDGFAEGLLGGLKQAFAGDVRVNIGQQLNAFSGINIIDFDGKAKALEQSISAMPLHIAVVMIGEDDRVPIRTVDGRRIALGSEEWTSEYTRRVDRLMRIFKSKNAAVYWVGLPTIGRIDANELAQRMNEIIRERAYLNGDKYIDAYQGFTDENGSYSAYGPDLDGAIRLLRLRDGVSFTDAGNRKLAHFVEKEVRPDLNQAKANRNIPLLGAEAEQAKINPDNAVKTPAPSSPVSEQASASKKAPIVRGPALGGAASSTADGSGDQKADNGRVVLKIVGSNGREDTQTIEILRPAIPASVVALMARREASGQRGDLLVDQIAGGLTLMSSITPSGGKDRNKFSSPTQAPYFRLLVKGERLQPRPGRADDVSWPPKLDSTSDLKSTDAAPRG